MAVITYPAALVVNRQTWGQKRFDLRFQNGDSGAGQSRILAPSRWMASLSCHPDLTAAESAAWRALILDLDGQVNQLALYDLINPAPQGTLRGALKLTAQAAAGATSIALQAQRPLINLLQYTEQFNQAAVWGLANVTVTPASITAPDGTLTGTLLTDTSAVSPSLITQAIGAASIIGTAYTASIHVKAGASVQSTFNCYSAGGVENNVTVTWTAGVPSMPTGTVTSVGSGWYRLAVPVVPDTTGGFTFRFWPNDRGSATSTANMYVWGAQVEIGPLTNYQRVVLAPNGFDVVDYANVGKTLLRGDWLGIGSGLTRQLVSVPADVTTNGAGSATVDIRPAVRWTQANGSAAVWDKPTALFRNTASQNSWDAGVFEGGYSLDLMESWE